MVVAATRIAERVRARSLAQRRDGPRRRDVGNRLEQFGDVWSRQREVAVAATGDDGEEAAVDESRQMVARRGSGDAGLGCQHARGQRPPVAEGHQYLCPGRLGEQGTD